MSDIAIPPTSTRGLPGHSTVGTNNLDAAAAFYDKLLAVFGIGRVLVQPGKAVYYGHMALEFGVVKPFNGEAARIGNGNMVAFEARSQAEVREVHATAIANGGSCEGAPGSRGDSNGPYCAYFRDPEGNKFLVYRNGPDEV
ncbi:catechol 2,3-dioxygenase-like lactoylglutathione lyase family enzyme [Rhizobium azooxidifex]|uniref:Catechol 2,3-dioxygenase-like lactoylglutathione lyase family enzyme n=1 Tax=Mycoplana azooxidifex TaxID=1636188 RepID=A0A7W6GN82_9HYPH|nr:VOC family protein [Mycoplana azooxidifex]MBB3979699.1 catechol 2,3-dioxygenase-like lactoylglutathione lyase family enzyme [Mycoplana azooxidifex]